MKILTLCLSFFLVACVADNNLKGTKKEDAIQAYIDLAYGYLQDGQNEAAKVPLKSALGLDEYHQEANLALANVFQREGENQLARKYYSNALVANPQDPETNANFANFLYTQKDYASALKYYQIAAADPLYPQRSLVLEAMGLTYSKMGNLPQAKDYLSKALQLRNNLPTSLFELANIALLEGDSSLALTYYNAAAKFNNFRADNLLTGYKIYQNLNMYNEAANIELKMKNLYANSAEYQQLLQAKNKTPVITNPSYNEPNTMVTPNPYASNVNNAPATQPITQPVIPLPNQVNNNNMPGLNAPADNAGFRFQPSPEYQLPTNTVQQQRQSPVVPPVHTYNQGIAPVQMQQQPQMQQQQSYPQQIPQVQPQNNMPIIKEVSNTVQVRPIGRSVTQPIKPQPINVGSFYGR